MLSVRAMIDALGLAYRCFTEGLMPHLMSGFGSGSGFRVRAALSRESVHRHYSRHAGWATLCVVGRAFLCRLCLMSLCVAGRAFLCSSLLLLV